MPLFDAAGKPIADTQDQWMAAALFAWLSDRRVREVLVQRRLATMQGIRVLGGLLDAGLREHIPVDPKILRKEMLNILRDRIVRRVVVRVALEVEREEYDGYLAHLRGGGEPLPYDRIPREPRPVKAILKELQETREELEANPDRESTIITA